MEIILTKNGVNQIAKGTNIYQENQTVESISLIIKGRVRVHKKGLVTTLNSGSFLGICDVSRGKYATNYTAYDDLMLYVFPVKSQEDIALILSENKEYGGLMVISLSRYIKELDKICRDIHKETVSIHEFLVKYYSVYKKMGIESGYTTMDIPLIEELEDVSFETNWDQRKLEYYIECSQIPMEVQKDFYSKSEGVALYHIEEQVELVQQIISSCTEMSCYLFELSEGLMSEEDACLFKCIADLAMRMGQANMNNQKVIDLEDVLIDKINIVEKLSLDKAGMELMINRDEMEDIYYRLLSKSTSEETKGKNKEDTSKKEKVEKVFKNSMNQILNYCNCSEEICEDFKRWVLRFSDLKDKFATDDETRKLRRQITTTFYEIYESVFIKNYEEQGNNPAIELFLKYGFVDENLLSKERLEELYLLEDQEEQTGPCKVYNIKEWLTLIIEGSKEPSKNEFDLDYKENLRNLRKSNRITEAEAKAADEDVFQKLHFEIQNVFRYNNRVISGQLSIFVPILHEEQFVGSIEKSFLTKSQVNAAINRLTNIDYSVFYREVLYVNPGIGINKEYIMEEVFPDIILFPVRGVNAVMWQEISGRKRNTSGRFLLPAFAEGDVESMLTAVFGRFRWELCRTIQGASWNNIKYRSLTSEYSDYVQFYRKNRELSEEWKDKLKMQIQKARSNSKEVFVADYVIWMKNESQGSIRLNKTVREIMATYIPFPKEQRTKLLNQPLFEEAMARFTRENMKKIREMDLRYRGLERADVELPEELIKTRTFYKDM